jgi:hypothetical protein
MVVRGLYLRYLEPIVQYGEYLRTFPAQKLYVVAAIYPLPLLEVDLCDAAHLGANLTTTESSEVEIDDVYLDDLELGHYRFVPIDDFSVTYMAKPKARPFLTTKNVVWELPKLSDPSAMGAEYLNLNEIFQFEDTEMWIKATANAGTLTAAILAFYGFRLILSEVDKLPSGIRPTVVPVEGYPGTTR